MMNCEQFNRYSQFKQGRTQEDAQAEWKKITTDPKKHQVDDNSGVVRTTVVTKTEIVVINQGWNSLLVSASMLHQCLL